MPAKVFSEGGRIKGFEAGGDLIHTELCSGAGLKIGYDRPSALLTETVARPSEGRFPPAAELAEKDHKLDAIRVYPLGTTEDDRPIAVGLGELLLERL